jgi:hypothetical protein
MRNGKRKKDDVVREQPLTYHDYATLDDGKRYELVDGMLELMTPSPSPDHQSVSRELFKQFSSGCEQQYVINHTPKGVGL